jgi:hypothetical protein
MARTVTDNRSKSVILSCFLLSTLIRFHQKLSGYLADFTVYVARTLGLRLPSAAENAPLANVSSFIILKL